MEERHDNRRAADYSDRSGSAFWQASSWDTTSTPIQPSPSHYEKLIKCTNCFTLGCELNCTKNCLKEISFQLASKLNELLKCEEDRARFHKELNLCLSEVQNLKQEKIADGEKLHLSFTKIENLENELKASNETRVQLDEKCCGLEEKCSYYVEKCAALTQENEMLKKSQHVNDCGPDISPHKILDKGKAASGSEYCPLSPDESEKQQQSSYDLAENLNAKDKLQMLCEESSPQTVPDRAVLQEVKTDLFDSLEDCDGLAHCVGADLLMSSGIAVQFRKKFGSIDSLLEQNRSPGEVAFLKKGNKYIYYLVTEDSSTGGKPVWMDFERSVIEWRSLCVEHGVKSIHIPKLECGRDWVDIKKFLEEQFSNTSIELTVHITEYESSEKPWKLKLCHSHEDLSQLDPRDCALVFIGSKDHFITSSIERLGKKFGFLSDYTGGFNASMGSLYCYRNRDCDAFIFGLIVKEKHTDPVSFYAIGQCLQALKRIFKRCELWYMGIEAFDDPLHSNVTRKFWTAVSDVFSSDDIEVYFCWPEDVKEKCWGD